MKYIYLTLIVFFVNCNQSTEQINIDEQPENCFSPSDGIYKFSEFRAGLLYDKILLFFSDNHIDLSSEDKSKISNWIKDEVFNAYSNKTIVEWNINDNDFCKLRTMTIEKPDGTVTDTVSIRICNSIENEDVSVDGFSQLRIQEDKAFLSVEYCSKILKTLNNVAYYEVLKIDNRLRSSLNNCKLKHRVQTDIYVHYNNNRNTKIRKKILSDKAFLYSGLLNLVKSDYAE